MANSNMTFSVGIKTNYDASGVNQLKKELQDIQKLGKDIEIIGSTTPHDLVAMTKSARELERALDAAYDPQIGTVNIDRFNKSLQASGTNLKQVQEGLKQAGTQGEKAFLGASRHLLQMNKVVRESNTLLDKMATTMANTVRWGITSTLWNNITGSIQTAFYYVKDLDTALNDIRIVTGKSAEDMANFAVEANNAAKALAVTTEDYTRGALIYYQQGLDDNTVKTLTDITSMTANVTGQGMDTVSEQLTAVWNGYQVANQAAEEGIGVYEEYVDKMAAVGAATASDLEELSTAMSKVASAAASMGVGFDSLNAQIATIVSVTRQAPESVGTALKTIYARMGDLQLGKSDEDGVGLGQVSGELDKLGIAVLDAQGNMRDMEEVITEVGEAWDTWTEAERQAIAVALAGKRQYNNLIALFDNWTMYTDTLNVSLESAGTLQEQQAIAAESLANKMDILRATAEDLYDNLFNEEGMKSMVDGATKLLQILTDVVDSIGGLQTILPMIGAIGMRVFSTQISSGLVNMVNGLTKTNTETKMATTNFVKLKEQYGNIAEGMDPVTQEAWQKMVALQERRLSIAHLITEEEQKQFDIAMERIANSAIKEIDARDADKGATPSFMIKDTDLTSVAGAAELQKMTIAWNQASNHFKMDDKSLRDSINQQTKGKIDIVQMLSDKLSQTLQDGDYFIQENADEFIQTFVGKYGEYLEIFETESIDGLSEAGKKRIKEDAQYIVDLFEEEFSQSAQDASSFADIVDNNVQAHLEESMSMSEIDTIELNTHLKETGAIISDVVGSVSSLATGFMTLGQLSNIWGDENLTGWEKFGQTVSNLTIALPMLISGITGVTAALNLENIAKVANTAATIANALARKLNGEAAEEEGQEISKNTENTGKDTAKKLKDAFSSLGKSLPKIFKGIGTAFTTFFTNPAGLAVAALVAVLAILIGTVSGVNAAQAAKLKAAEEDLEATKAQVAATKEQVEANNKLISSYDDLINRYEEGTLSEEEFRKEAVNICDQMDLQSEKIKVLCGEYGTLEQAIRDASIAQNDAYVAQLQQQKDAAAAVMEAGFAKGTSIGWDLLKSGFNIRGLGSPLGAIDSTASLISTGVHLAQGVKPGSSETISGGFWGRPFDEGQRSIETSAKEYLGEYYFGDVGSNAFTIGNVETAEDQYKVYTAIQEILKENAEYANNAEYKQLQEIATNMEKGALAYKESLDAQNTTNLDSALKDSHEQLENAKTYNDFLKERETLINNAVEAGMSEEDATAQVDAYLKGISGIEEYLNKLSIQTSFAKMLGIDEDEVKQKLSGLSEEAQEWLFLNYNEDMSFDSAIEIAKKIEESGIADVSASIKYVNSGSEILSMFEESDKEGSFSQEQKDAIFASPFGSQINQEEFNDLDYEAQKDLIIDLYSTEAAYIAENTRAAKEKLETELEAAQAEAELAASKADEATDAAKKAAELKESGEYAEKIAELEAKRDKNDVGSDKWLDYNEKIKAVYQEIYEEVGMTADEIVEAQAAAEASANEVAALSNELGKLEDVEIDIKVNESIIAQIDNIVDDVVGLSDEIQSAMSLIDESFRVSAENVQALADTFPELLQGVEYYADGSIQLNSDVVNAFISGQSEELEAEKEKALASIDAQIALKEATIEMLENQLDIAAEALEQNKSMEDIKGEISENVTKFINDNNLQAYANIDEAAMTSTGNIVDYWNSVQEAVAAAGNAMAKAARGEEVQVQKVQLATGEQVEYKELDNYKGVQKDVAEFYNATLESIEQEQANLADLVAQRSRLLSAYDSAFKPDGGKGSGSSKSSKSQKDYEDEYDRYWEFNKLIEKVTDTIEDLDEAQENLHGRELISALENENKLLDKQAKAYEKLYAEQKKEQAELQESLGNFGLQFDADGAITNYAAQTSQMLSDYNRAVAEYNAGLMSEETFAIYEQNYEKFKAELARYEELYYSEMKDVQDKLKEIRKQQRANNLEAWENEIELKLETSEFERDAANFLHDIEDDFKKVYEDLSDDFENIFANMGTYDTDISTTLQAIKDVTAEIDKMKNGEESDMFESISQAQEKLKELNKELQDSAKSMHDLWVDAWNAYLEGIDQSADKLEDLNEKYERIGQEIEFQGDLIKLLYGDEAYDLMAHYFEAQKTNTLAQVDSFRQQRDMWKQMYESAEEGSEDQQKYYELMNEAQDNLNNSVKEYVELLQNEAINAIDGALKKYENLITNGQGLDVVNEQWERTKSYADAVFDSVEKTYHVQDLASKIKQSINDAEGLKSQQKLQELYDKEINYLLDKKELTQYDIDAANARYQIALKEIALEEAQNAKNSMKVVRGADGNWDYQYVADDENVEEKKRELSDSIYALYELANSSYMESMDNLLEIEQKYQEQSKALAEEAIQTGADVSEQKRALDEWYESEKTRISEQGALARQDMLTSSVGVLKDAYDNNIINYENMTKSQIALIEGVSQAGVNSFADLEIKVNENFQNIGDMAHQVIAETVLEWNNAAWDIAEQWIGDDGSIKQAFEEVGATLTQITEDYKLDIEELGEVADMNLGEDGIGGALQDNIELTEELEGATENLVATSIDELEEYQDALSAVEEAWYAVKDSITSAIDEIREYLALAGQASNKDVDMDDPTAGKGNDWDFGKNNPGKKTPPGGGDPFWGWVVKEQGAKVETGVEETESMAWDKAEKIRDREYDYGTPWSALSIEVEKGKKFDTGGYTGEWSGGEGKVAMLHSKELVLNAKDTENILDAVSAVRSFTSIGNSINEAIMSGIAKMLLSASGKVLSSVSKVDNSSNDNSQNIFHINAEFPNANDMAEIQAAILSLPRIASQQTEIIVK